MKNKVQLITYADRLGTGTLASMTDILRTRFDGVYEGVHILPFFTPFDGADAGFDPIDHTAVDPRLGDWDDVAELARTHGIMVDAIVNHMSWESSQFQDVLAKGEESKYFPMFLMMSTVYPDGATEEELAGIYRPRPGLPFTHYTCGGKTRLVWTTFTPQQVDIDTDSEQGWAYLMSIFDRMAASHVSYIRLDAVGYGAKEADSSCFMTDIDTDSEQGWAYLMSIFDRMAASHVSYIRLDAVGYGAKEADSSCFMTPKTFELIGRLREEGAKRGLEILIEVHSYYRKQIEIASKVDRVYDFALPPLLLHSLFTGHVEPVAHWTAVREVHSYYRKQIEIASKVDRVYDFALPPLLLHSLFTGHVEPVAHWTAVRPNNAVTVLDTHDGIGVIDIGSDQLDRSLKGLIPDKDVDALVNTIHANTHGESAAATGAAASNLDLYQVNSTYYAALGGNDQH